MAAAGPDEGGETRETGEVAEGKQEGARNLLLDELDDRLDAFQALRKSDADAADAVLGDMGAHDGVDRDIVLELGAKRPLGHPERFERAHSLAIRSLEVLDRNGGRSVKVPRVRPLKPMAEYLVKIVTQFLVRSYLASAIDAMHRLYQRREAACLHDDPARPLLYRAMKQTERVQPGFKRNPLGVPTFLLGGAVLSGGLNAARAAIVAAVSSTWIQVLITIVVFVIFLVASWVILRGAATARRRIVMTTVRPMEALWETIGRCGKPPGDQSKTFALIALILTVVSFAALPIGLALSLLS